MNSDKNHWALIAKLNNEDLWRVSYGELDGLTHEQLRERQPMKYEALFPGPRPLKYDLRNFAPYRIHQRCCTTFRVGRVLLAGDAAHICNPFGGYDYLNSLSLSSSRNSSSTTLQYPNLPSPHEYETNRNFFQYGSNRWSPRCRRPRRHAHPHSAEPPLLQRCPPR
jgi:hypothetical protein